MMRATILSTIAAFGIVTAGPLVDTVSDATLPYEDKPFVNSATLQSRIKIDNLMSHAKALQAIAYGTTARNRFTGTLGHNRTVEYVYKQLTDPSLGGYYNVTLQPFTVRIIESASGSLFVAGKNISITVADFSPSGTFKTPLALIPNKGCNQTDYQNVTGKVVLISRGTCYYDTKSSLAGKNGAAAAIIFNNAPGAADNLALDPKGFTEFGPFIPTVGTSKADGEALAASIKNGSVVTVAYDVKTVTYNASTNNVLAESKYGDPNSILMLGAHSDSVKAGPGINDNGSGLATVLEVAKNLASYQTHNKVRFGWWSAEEIPTYQVGAMWFIDHSSPAEISKIKAYLNFDMMASPNYAYGIQDGDNSSFNTTYALAGPQGSGDIEKLFQRYFESRGLNHTPSAMDGRSDYNMFQYAGIPVGGLATGAELNKTKAGVEMFGGFEGVPFDKNYHSAGDTAENLNVTAFLANAQAAAHAAATYATSFADIKSNRTTNGTVPARRKRDVVDKRMRVLSKQNRGRRV